MTRKSRQTPVGLRLNGEDVNLDVLVAEVGLEWRAVFREAGAFARPSLWVQQEEHCERNRRSLRRIGFAIILGVIPISGGTVHFRAEVASQPVIAELGRGLSNPTCHACQRYPHCET